MLEHVPNWLGGLLRGVRAGHAKLVVANAALGLGSTEIALSSPAFAANGRLPVRFTADGAGISPPLVWGDVPAATRSLALIVEDSDAPAPQPLVHAIVWGLPASERRLAEGAIAADGAGGPDGRDVGRNSYFSEGWLPPDPPTGHGPHDYVFQLFALAETAPVGRNPGRSAIGDRRGDGGQGAGGGRVRRRLFAWRGGHDRHGGEPARRCARMIACGSAGGGLVMYSVCSKLSGRSGGSRGQL